MSDFTDLYDEDDDTGQDVTCDRCGKEDCFFERVGDKYVLFEKRRFGIGRHVCQSRNVPLTDHFEDIP